MFNDNKKRVVTLSGAGNLQLGGATQFQAERERERAEKIRERRRNEKAKLIQAFWRGSRVRLLLAQKACNRLFDPAWTPIWKDILLMNWLTTQPLACIWRKCHTSQKDIQESRASGLVVVQSLQDAMKRLLAGKQTKYISKPQVLFDSSLWVEWKSAVEEAARSSEGGPGSSNGGKYRCLAPCWMCVISKLLNLAVTVPVESPDVLKILCTFCLQAWANYKVWEIHAAVSPEMYCSCSGLPLSVEISQKLEQIRAALSKCLMVWLKSPDPSGLNLVVSHPEMLKTLIGILLSTQIEAKNQGWSGLAKFFDDPTVAKRLQHDLLRRLLVQMANTGFDLRPVLAKKNHLFGWIRKCFEEGGLSSNFFPMEARPKVAIFALRMTQVLQTADERLPQHLRDQTASTLPLVMLLSVSLSTVELSDHPMLPQLIHEKGLISYLFTSATGSDCHELIPKLKLLFPLRSIDSFFKSRDGNRDLPDSASNEMALVHMLVNPGGGVEEMEDNTDSPLTTVKSGIVDGRLGYVTPLDLQTFDQLIVSSVIFRELFLEIGQELLVKCEADMSEFVKRLGPTPDFNSDLGLLLKAFVAILLRRCLILDDDKFITSASILKENVHPRDLLSLWLTTKSSDDILPFTPRQGELFCHVINVLAFHLTTITESWAYSNGLTMSVPTDHTSASPMYLVHDVCNLARSLYRRVQRINLKPEKDWVLPQATSLLLGGRTRPAIEGASNNAMSSTFSQAPFIAKGAGVTCLQAALNGIPHCFLLQDRIKIFVLILKEDRARHGRPDGGHIPPFAPRVPIRRSHIIEDAFTFFLHGSRYQNFHQAVAIQFLDDEGDAEMGIDGGGITREFLSLLAAELFSPEKGLFRLTSTGSLLPNPSAESLFKHDSYSAAMLFELAGFVVGKALYESVILSTAELNPLFLNRIINETNYFDDLKFSDVDVHKNIQFVKNYEGDPVELGLTFSLDQDSTLGTTVDLMKNGRFMPVTSKNRHQYVLMLSHFLANSIMDKATAAFVKGLTKLIDLRWLRLFNATGLQQLISGLPESGFNVDDLQRYTVYAGTFTAESETIQYFWEILRESSGEFRSKFLHFVTSTNRTPLLGFGSLYPPFAIVSKDIANLDELPTASTCTNMLRMPDYKDKELLRRKLEAAVLMAAGFHLA